MPLAIRCEHDRYFPIVVCDHCGKEIRAAADGNYQWLWTDELTRIYFTHKACCFAFEERQGGDWAGMELVCLPAYLVKNLGIEWAKSKKLADYLSQL